jgi:hypothetical protein
MATPAKAVNLSQRLSRAAVMLQSRNLGFVCQYGPIMGGTAEEVGMRTLKSVFGVAGAIVPVLYCGGLLFYFLHVGGSVEGAQEIGLGPTVIGLGVVGMLLCIPLILKIGRLFSGSRPSGSGGRPDGGDDDNGFDADAAIARYMASRTAEASPSAPIVSPGRGGGSAGRASRPGFGRRVK